MDQKNIQIAENYFTEKQENKQNPCKSLLTVIIFYRYVYIN